MSKELLLFPFGGSAREALITILSHSDLKNQWNVLGFVDEDPALKGQQCCGTYVLGTKEIFTQYPKAMILAVPAHPAHHLERKAIIQSLSTDSSRFATIIHPSCVIAPNANIGYNTFISPNCFISANARIGNHCVLLSQAIISHDCRIGDFCCIGGGVTISGGVKVDSCTYIGSGVSIRENMIVGECSFIGMGSNVVSDVPSKMVVFGNPAKGVRENT